jgi:protein-L-isoaspartate(D-aspartate) O-methyltransferase
MPDYALQRRMMVDGQVRTFDVSDPAVIDAMMSVPREAFVPEALRSLAYCDQPLRLDDGTQPGGPRHLLIPMVIGRMLQSLGVKPGDRVLDVASGTGYTAALLAHMGAAVVALESIPALADAAALILPAVGAPDVRVVTGRLVEGDAAGAPYDAIFVNGAFADIPEALPAQLREGGRMILVLGTGRAARVVLVAKGPRGDIGERPIFDAAASLLAPAAHGANFVFQT